MKIIVLKLFLWWFFRVRVHEDYKSMKTSLVSLGNVGNYSNYWDLTHRHFKSRAWHSTVHCVDATSPGRGQILHIERAPWRPGQGTGAGHQANVSLSSGVNKPEFPRKLCSYFSVKAINKISWVKQVYPWLFKNVLT